MTDKCAYPKCGKELVHTEGRRKKKYCGADCKLRHWQQLNPIKKEKTVSNKVELPADFINVTKIGIIDEKGKITDLLSEDGKTFLLSSPETLKLAYRSLFEEAGICKIHTEAQNKAQQSKNTLNLPNPSQEVKEGKEGGKECAKEGNSGKLTPYQEMLKKKRGF